MSGQHGPESGKHFVNVNEMLCQIFPKLLTCRSIFDGKPAGDAMI